MGIINISVSGKRPVSHTTHFGICYRIGTSRCFSTSIHNTHSTTSFRVLGPLSNHALDCEDQNVVARLISHHAIHSQDLDCFRSKSFATRTIHQDLSWTMRFITLISLLVADAVVYAGNLHKDVLDKRQDLDLAALTAAMMMKQQEGAYNGNMSLSFLC